MLAHIAHWLRESLAVGDIFEKRKKALRVPYHLSVHSQSIVWLFVGGDPDIFHDLGVERSY